MKPIHHRYAHNFTPNSISLLSAQPQNKNPKTLGDVLSLRVLRNSNVRLLDFLCVVGGDFPVLAVLLLLFRVLAQRKCAINRFARGMQNVPDMYF